ncbi:MAG: hypothetical protein ISS27_01715 [Candidatus Omnitrophica bacterium]|nr:hypothetical protein [Candidatus Omnitrophota bacterium]
MRKQTRYKVTVGVVAAVCVLLGVGFVIGRATGGGRRPQGMYRGFGRPDKEQILRLRQEDPEKFNKFLGQRKGQLREKLTKLKEMNPQRYERISQGITAGQVERLDSLRQQNPQGFKQAIHKHKGRMEQHLEALKVRDPEFYQQIISHQDDLKKLRQLHREDPKQARQYLEEHPELSDLWEQIRCMRDTAKSGFAGYTK